MKERMKGFIAGIFSVILVLSLSVGVYAAAKTISVNGGMNITIDGIVFIPKDAKGNVVDVFEYNGTTYVPLRAVSAAFGKEVAYEAATRTAIINTPEQQRLIYMTRTGNRYHYDNTCNGGTYFETTLEQVQKIGLGPCDKCVH